MRFLGRFILFLLIFVPSLVAGYRLWNSLYWSELAAVLEGRIEQALPTTAYRTLADRWMDFPLSGKGRALRVRSNGITDRDSPQPPETEWWYAFEYQLLNAAGERVREGVYHHRTRLQRFKDPESGRLIGRNFLLDPALAPADGRSMLLYFVPEERPVRLRIRPLEKDPALGFVLFRVYEKLETSPRELDYLWQRLGESKKARLTVGSVYGPEFLQQQEQRNLLHYQWKAVGPLGVEHEQYQSMKLYLSRGMEAESVEQGVLPYGVYGDRRMRGMIPIPEGDWEVKLELVPLDHAGAEVTTGGVRVRWYGRGLAQRWQGEVPADAGEVWLAPRFNGGLLEITPPGPTVVRAWARNDDSLLQITPEPLQLRAYRAGPATPLNLQIDHVGRQPTPFRVDLRALLPPGEEAVRRTIDYELLDALGRPVDGGQLQAHLIRSNYDRSVTLEQDGGYLSEPVRYYFDLPVGVAAVRLTPQQELLLVAYSRPPALVREIKVPEDYQSFGNTPTKQPAWFLLRPLEAERLRREFRTVALIVQPRPPETDPRLLAGQYDWRSYQPGGKWRGRYLLVPREADTGVRDQGLGSVYRELEGSRSIRIQMRAPEGHRQIEPTVLYLRDDAEPMEVKLRLDGELHYATRVAGERGEIRLPAMSPGAYRLTIEAPARVRWFLNHADVPAPAYLRRLALQVGPEGLVFDYPKQSQQAEVLTGEFFSRSAERSPLRVSIEAEAESRRGPLVDWTFRDRLFDLRPGVDGAVPVLNSGIEALRGGQRFVLPLGSDLPAGSYRVRIATAGEGQGFLTLYRLIAGQSEIRTFFRERVYGP